MTLMAIGKTPDVWAAAVEEYGIIDWQTMLQHEDPSLQQYEAWLLGDPGKDRAVYEADSPHHLHAERESAAAGAAGRQRYPRAERRSRASGGDAEGRRQDRGRALLPDEGHGFAKRENQIDAIRRTIDWFDRYLKGNEMNMPIGREVEISGYRDKSRSLAALGMTRALWLLSWPER